MLTTTTKNWLAEHAGSSGCFGFTGITYTDPDGAIRSGSTGDVINAFVVAHMIGKDSVMIIDNTNYTQLKAINNNNDMDIGDVAFVYNNDGVPSSEPRYCTTSISDSLALSSFTRGCDGFGPSSYISQSKIKLVNNEFGDGIACAYSANQFFTIGESIYVTLEYPCSDVQFWIWDNTSNTISSPIEKISDLVYKTNIIDSKYGFVALYGNGSPVFTQVSFTGPPTPTPPPPPIVDTPVGVFEFVAPPEGDPTATLNLSNLIMRQTGDGHFEMNNILIKNTSNYPIYIAIRIKLFEGNIPVCRPSGEVFDGMDRTDTELRSLRIKALEIGESANYNADFFQPANILGPHTVCMLIHGAWTRADVQDEIDKISG